MKYNYLVTYYWLIKQFGGGKKRWTKFHHNGVIFPPDYIPHNIPVIYEGEKIHLTPKAEEAATMYAKYIDTEYAKNRIFNKNFWNDWKKILGKDHIIKSLESCNFKLIHNYLMEDKEKKKNIPKHEKELLKQEKENFESKYKIAYVDDKPQPVGNFRIEPPGIFIGRGCHPKLGKIKHRIYPEDITLNLSKDAIVPVPPIGHKWGKIIHDNNVEWLASWKDDISGKVKYVWLGAHSDFKAESDKNKFDKARKLKKNIKKIREENDINLKNTDPKIRQIATALYFIDNLALRVGNEKGEDEADTVGVTSLRVEHIELLNNNKVKLDFLGKDSVHYVNTVEVSNTVYSNLRDFTENKNKDDPLFEKMNSNDLNKYLQSFMKELTAKVFRTYNASNLFQKELTKVSNKYDKYNEQDKLNLLLDEFNKANAKVALLCNHQKNISKSFSDQLKKINEKISEVKKKIKDTDNKEKIKKLKIKLNQLKSKKDLKIEMKNISLGTSKINYIDPRITIAFMKKHNLPVDKIFSKTLQDKFNWAMDTDSSFVF